MNQSRINTGQKPAEPVWTGDMDTDLRELRRLAFMPGVAALDFETTVSRARDREVCTIQITHENGGRRFAYVYPRGKAALKFVMDGAKAEFVAHNALFETECLVKNGVEGVYPQCTMIAAKVLEGTMEGDKSHRTLWSLAALVERKLGKTRDKTIRDEDWTQPPTPEMVDYGMEDTDDTLKLWNIWREQFDDLSWAGYRTIMDAMPAVVESNLTGLPFDKEAHADLCVNLSRKVKELDAQLDTMVDLIAGDIANHGSTQQVANWMMQVLMHGMDPAQIGDPVIFSMAFQAATGQHWPTTKTGALSLDRKAVETRLKALTEIAPDVADYLLLRLQRSKAAKLLQAFGPKLAEYVDDDGYVRCTFKPHGAQTSRLSAQSPNLQQQPAEEEFRRLYKAKKGRKLIICDYGQIELRVGCIIADDKVMQAVFGQGRDIHSATFENVQRALGREVTYDPDNKTHVKGRKAGKPVTFAALYGAMAATIAANAGLPLHEAEELLDAWLTAYPGIRKYRDEAFQKAKAAGGVRLVSGQFLRMAPDTRPSQAINAPVQGSSASVLYKAMKLVHDDVVALRNLGCDIDFAASIHDEIILDAAETDAEEARNILQQGMVRALLHFYPEASKLGMASLADAAIVESWADKP